MHIPNGAVRDAMFGRVTRGDAACGRRAVCDASLYEKHFLRAKAVDHKKCEKTLKSSSFRRPRHHRDCKCQHTLVDETTGGQRG